MNDPIQYQIGFDDSQREQAAILYDDAFGKKLALAIPSRDRRIQIFKDGFEPTHCYVALRDKIIVGIAGHKSQSGSLTGRITLRSLFASLPLLGAIRAALILAVYDRPPKPGQLLMDGIAVSASERGNGLGSRLLSLIAQHARDTGHASVRLDVIDSNPAARRLYERYGFLPTGRTELGVLKTLFGFSGATIMELKLGRQV